MTEPKPNIPSINDDNENSAVMKKEIMPSAEADSSVRTLSIKYLDKKIKAGETLRKACYETDSIFGYPAGTMFKLYCPDKVDLPKNITETIDFKKTVPKTAPTEKSTRKATKRYVQFAPENPQDIIEKKQQEQDERWQIQQEEMQKNSKKGNEPIL